MSPFRPFSLHALRGAPLAMISRLNSAPLEVRRLVWQFRPRSGFLPPPDSRRRPALDFLCLSPLAKSVPLFSRARRSPSSLLQPFILPPPGFLPLYLSSVFAIPLATFSVFPGHSRGAARFFLLDPCSSFEWLCCSSLDSPPLSLIR